MRQARERMPTGQARNAAMRAVARTFAMPLRAAGIDASVAVRFVDPAGREEALLSSTGPRRIRRSRARPRRRAADRHRRDGEMTMNAPNVSLKGLDLRAEIDRLRKERNAVILGHYYQTPEIQDIADFVGDSLDLSRKAEATDADVIAFCGVRFMAETAKILSPEKIVVLPDMDAGCSLEDSCPPDQFKAFREAHPDHIALTYINCSAEVKALSDIIVTSSSAEIILKPDPEGAEDHLRPRQASRRLARPQDRPRHAALAGRVHRPRGLLGDRAAQAQGAASRRAGARPSRMPAAHPRPCRPCRLDLGDPRLCAALAVATTLIVATEPHIIHQMEKAAPHKTFIGAPGADGNCNCNMCPYMALNTMEKLYVALRDLEPRIEIEEGLRLAAKKSLDRMLEMAGRHRRQGRRRPAEDLGGLNRPALEDARSRVCLSVVTAARLIAGTADSRPASALVPVRLRHRRRRCAR